MKKGKRFQSVLAMGMAFSLAVMPMSAMAESVDETEFLTDAGAEVGDTIEDVMNASVSELSDGAYESASVFTFGDGFYNLYNESGVDFTWLENAYYSWKSVPADNRTDAELAAGLNDTDLVHVSLSADTQNGVLYVYIPELFEQPAAINFTELLMNALSSAEQTEESQEESYDDTNSIIMQMIFGYISELAGEAQELIASIPAETWQQEIMNYMMPVMNSIEQSADTGSMTVGDLEAQVQIQTFSISSEKMGELLSTIMTTLSQDPVLETLLTSDFVTNVLGLSSLFTSEPVTVTGEEILGQIRSFLDQAAAQDFSGMPGVSLSLYSDGEGKAFGVSLDMDMSGEKYNLCSLYAIFDGQQNAIQFSPSQTFMAMCGLDSSNKVDVIANGTTENNLLNEEIDIIRNDTYAVIVTLEDIDLQALQENKMIGTVGIEAEGVTASITYGVAEDGSQVLDYMFNGELFYNLVTYSGAAENTELEAIDYSSAAPITTVSELIDYVSTADLQNILDLLAEAGVPVSTEGTVAA